MSDGVTTEANGGAGKGSRRRALHIGGGLLALGGIAGIVALIAWQGFAEVGSAMLAAGWGIALVTAFHLLPMAASAFAWRSISAAAAPAQTWVYLWARLLREALNALLPVAQVGGDVIGARILTFHGNRAAAAGATILVDITLELVSQIMFTVLGLALLFANGDYDFAHWAVIGLGVAILAVGGFLMAQRWGLFLQMENLLERIGGFLGWPALGSLANLHATAMAIYRDRRAVIGGLLWHLASWLLGAAEVWLTLHVLGAELSFAEALIIESLGQAVRSAAFLVPGAYGVQEGGYMVLGMAFGLTPEVALSVSLIKRVRELALGLPPILAWQLLEGKRLLAVPKPTTPDSP